MFFLVERLSDLSDESLKYVGPLEQKRQHLSLAQPLNIMNCLLLCLGRAGQKCRLGKEAGDLVSAVRRDPWAVNAAPVVGCIASLTKLAI